MKKAAVSAVCAAVLLLSKLGATQLAPIYTSLVVMPFVSLNKNALAVAVALSATVSATWHPFDLVAASVSALISATVFF